MDWVQWCLLVGNPHIITLPFLGFRPWEVKVAGSIFSSQLSNVHEGGISLQIELVRVLGGW